MIFNNRRTFVSLASSLLALVALCRPAFAIQSGSPVTPQEIREKGLVILRIGGGASCSGVLLANDWVMTAGHCAITNRVSPGNITVEFDGMRINADAVYLFGGFADEVGPDLSLMHLQAKFRINGTTAGFVTPIWQGDPAKLKGRTIASYGQGPNAVTCGAPAGPVYAGVGTYRAGDFVAGDDRDAIRQPNNPASPPTTANFRAPDFHFFFETPSATDPGGAIRTHLPGDSGGPKFIFEGGIRQLVGILSGADICVPNPRSIHNNIPRLRLWIADVLKTQWSTTSQSQPVYVFLQEVAGTRWGFTDVNATGWAQGARAAAAMCYNRGFAGGHLDGNQGPFRGLGNGFGLQCSRGDTLWEDVTVSQMDPVWHFKGDINAVNWAQAGRTAAQYCGTRGYAGGQFNGHQRDGKYGVFCYRGGAQHFDASNAEISATHFPLPKAKLDDNAWASAARAAVEFCRTKGFGGGFFNGHQLPNKYGVVCQK